MKIVFPTIKMSEILVTEIQIIPVNPKNGLVAFASCVINNALYIGNIAIYTSPSRSSGYRLLYPSKTLINGKEVNCAYPINKETGEVIEDAILGKYKEIILKVENKAKHEDMRKMSVWGKEKETKTTSLL